MASDPLSIPSWTRLRVETVQERWISGLQPFLRAIDAGVQRGQGLGDAVRAAAGRFPDARSSFHLDPARPEETFALRESRLFPDGDPLIALHVERAGEEGALVLELEGVAPPRLAELLRRLSAGTSTEQQLRSAFGEPELALLDGLLAGQHLRRGPAPPPARATSRPGLYRLQHAALLVRTATTAVLVDPHRHSVFAPPGVDELLPAALAGSVDAVLVSHGHGDHYDLTSLMTFPADVPIVVPRVPRQTLLCDDMAARLRGLGFSRVVAAGWDEGPLTIGDIQLVPLPFFGEQPLRHEQPLAPELRNWGNTYLLRTPDWSAWLLVDAGDDAWGTMAEVAHRVRREYGRVDYVLSNLREFPVANPFYILGDGRYWLSLRPDQRARFAEMRSHTLTLGPSGVAEVARIVGARCVLPYAHWWGEPGAPLAWEAPLLAGLAATGVPVNPWRIGEAVHP